MSRREIQAVTDQQVTSTQIYEGVCICVCVLCHHVWVDRVYALAQYATMMAKGTSMTGLSS